MKKYLLLVTLILFSSLLKAQDVISLKTGETIKAKVKEIGTNTIKYRLFESLDGPDYVLERAKIMVITYENGRKEFFSNDTLIDESSPIVKNTNQALPDFTNPEVYTYAKGAEDASYHYHGQNAGRTGVLLTALLTNGLIGLIPAIPCSLTPPQLQNMGIPNIEVYKNNPAYAEGYRMQAKKIKSGKIWKNWGIGTAISTVLILIAYVR